MTQPQPFPLLQLPAFKELSEAGATRLQNEVQGLQFELGQQLCEPAAIPARILVLMSLVASSPALQKKMPA